MVAAHLNKPRSKKTYFRLRKTAKTKRTSTKKKASSTAKTKAIVQRELKKDLEIKLKPLGSVYNANPLNQDTSVNVVYYNNYCLGSPAATWLGPTGAANFVGLGGFSWPQGTANNQRIGKYMTLNHTTMSFRVGLIGVPRTAAPVRFRVLVYKAKRNAILGTSGGNPNENLFITTNGEERGLNNSYGQNAVGYEFMNMLVNKRNYEVYCDKQFILCNPVFTVQGGSNIVTPISQGMYPNEKNFLWKLPHNEKVAFGVGDIPEDSRYQYCVTILSMPTGDLTSTGQQSWRTSLRGVVSAIDA